MSTQMIEVSRSVPKEAFELCQYPVEVLKAWKQAMADGWQPTQDIPAIVLAAVMKAPAALQGIDLIPGEIAEKRGAVVQAAALSIGDIVAAVL